MANNDLNKPLGLTDQRKTGSNRIYLLAGAAVVALAALGGGLWLIAPKGPTVTAVITAPPPGTSTIAPDRTASITPVTGIEEVAPDGGLSDIAGGQVVISDPTDDQPMILAALPRDDVSEETADGILPRIAADGARPLDVYARPSVVDNRDLRIAIVIGGIGIDREGTQRAISDLPGQVTLALAPYGEHLDKTVADARTAGHELLLQVPLEPFNYPKTNPGPNTLTSAATAQENIDRLHWFMSRMTSYVGVVNYMGGKFTGEAEAMGPVMAEISSRGLLYLDDGSSARSKAGEIAGGSMPFLRADVVLDADLSAAAIDARLKQLQAIARERGYAIATATAFPITIDRVAEFAKAAEKKGISLVPLSALANGPT